MKRKPQPSFAQALRRVRRGLGIAQEAFDQVSSRTYISSLERGLKQPTLAKIDSLAGVLGVHPMTLLTLSYADKSADVAELLEIVQKEISALPPDVSD